MIDSKSESCMPRELMVFAKYLLQMLLKLKIKYSAIKTDC